jgi:IS5 family transposase
VNVHDSRVFDAVVDFENAGPFVWADSAYRREETEEALAGAGFQNQIHEKGQSNAALSDTQNEGNRERSRVRARVEHIFGSQHNEQGGKPMPLS